MIYAVSHLLGALAFSGLAGLLIVNRRRHYGIYALTTACALSAAWLFVSAAHGAAAVEVDLRVPALYLELARTIAWLVVLLGLLERYSLPPGLKRNLRLGSGIAVVLVLGGLLSVRGYYLPDVGQAWARETVTRVLVPMLMLLIWCLLLLEQFYRNAPKSALWSVKFLGLGLGAMLVYDFVITSMAVLLARFDPELWAARGAVNALVVPLLTIGVARDRHWNTDLFVSRQVVFHSATLVAAGLYLLFVAATGYYLKSINADWAAVLYVLFLFVASVLLLVLLFSGDLRARAKVFLAKHFYRNKYEYREEWLKFTQALSAGPGPAANAHLRVLQAIAGIIESTGGVLWCLRDDVYQPTARWNVELDQDASVDPSDPIVEFMTRSKWVLNLDEYRADSAVYDDSVPEWMAAVPDGWLVVPLLHEDALIGVVLLRSSRGGRTFTWEDADLLKNVGRQAAGYLALLNASEDLSEAKQFEAFNRLSAFVVHDLKNLVGQLSLIVANAERHKHKPEFVDDAFNTIQNVVERLNRMLSLLRQQRGFEGHHTNVDVVEIARAVAAQAATRRPVPTVSTSTGCCRLYTDGDQLQSILAHLVGNAQDATSEEGTVAVSIDADDSDVVITVHDTGHGMDAEFIRDRLFRPFDTTKGNAGMGIGAFESREFVRAAGGVLDVDSEPGVGTRFSIKLPRGLDSHEESGTQVDSLLEGVGR